MARDQVQAGARLPRGMTNVWLIGGPGDGGVIQAATGTGWIDVGESRYVLRETYPLEGGEPDGWVGIFLPLYASLLMARLGRRNS
jgi:hypothetical protein